MKIESYGYVEGKEAKLITLENENIILKVSSFAACMVDVIYKGKPVVLGYDNLEGYVHETAGMGKSVGRVCNRIAKGHFELNGKEYNLAINNGPNCLHGGNKGFHYYVWDDEVEENKVTFIYHAKDMEEGFPGNLTLKVIYELTENGFYFNYEGISDEDTLLNITNHAYFNLYGPDAYTVLDHELKIYSDTFGCVDSDGLTLGINRPVENSPFDFREFKTIGKDINVKDEQLIAGTGYDHHYIVNGDGMRDHAVLKANGLTMTVSSDLAGFHLYSANFLEDEGNCRGRGHRVCQGICFETEYRPDGINTGMNSCVLHKNTIRSHKTHYEFKEV